MAYKGLQTFVEKLEQAGELIRIKEYVNPTLEITEIVDRISKNNGPALLFENNGTGFPLLINAMGSEKRMCMALGVNNMDDITHDIEALFKDLTSPKEGWLEKLRMLPKLGKVASWLPKVVSGKGACQQVIITNPDLSKLPVMTCWPADGGPFMTLPVVHTKDPHTGIRNVGLYRVQVFDKALTALHWQLHKVSRRHYDEYKLAGKRMPVAIVMGGDPVYTYAASAPLPDNVDEYILAGFIRKKAVEMVKCITQPEIEVPADADIVVEGYVDTSEELILEGPFGDHTGYYSLPDYYPKFHVTAITHRKNAIYPSTIVGIPPQEDAWIGKATERIFLAPIKMTMVPEIIDMDLPIEGVFHNMAIIQINKTYPGQALKVMNALWGAGQMMFTKMMVIVDQHTSIKDYKTLAKYVSEHYDPYNDTVISQGPTDVLDHSCSKMAFGGKIGIDGTTKFFEEIGSPRTQIAPNATQIQLETLCTMYPEIEDINKSLLDKGISIVFLAIRKKRSGHIKELANELLKRPMFAAIKIIIFLDAGSPINNVADNMWRFCNNVDVKRDGAIFEGNKEHTSHIALDGTRKTLELDGFERDWPNILISTDDTIAHIDQIWDKLGLGKWIESPSKKYKPFVVGTGAVFGQELN